VDASGGAMARAMSMGLTSSDLQGKREEGSKSFLRFPRV